MAISSNDSQSDEQVADQSQIADLLGRIVVGRIDKAQAKQLVTTLRRSLKISRKGVTVSGQGLAELLMKTAPRIPIRDAETLSEQFGGMSDTALAGQLIRQASRSSAAVGGITGALASAGHFAPPAWVMFPAEIIGETLLIAAIEMKLVAELHEVYAMPITGSNSDRGLAILEAWAHRRGVRVEDLRSGGVTDALGRGTRSSIVQAVRRKVMARAARNISTLAPLFVGAVAGAELNRRSTRDLGDALVRDLVAKK